jgi:hypothetical protein
MSTGGSTESNVIVILVRKMIAFCWGMRMGFCRDPQVEPSNSFECSNKTTNNKTNTIFSTTAFLNF